MKTINIQKIITHRKLDKAEIAKLLFPSNAHPMLALQRLIDKPEAQLNADQISRFSMHTGIPIAELYNGHGWTSTTKGATHILSSGEYRAELDVKTWTTKVYHNESLIHDFVMHSSSITLSEYIQKLEQIIKQ